MNMKKVSFVNQSNHHHHRGRSIHTPPTNSMEQIMRIDKNKNAPAASVSITLSASSSAHNGGGVSRHHHHHGRRQGGTLKDRIKHKVLLSTSPTNNETENTAGDDDTNHPDHEDDGNKSNIKEGNQTMAAATAPARRESLLVAASALASLGGLANAIQNCHRREESDTTSATTLRHKAEKGGDSHDDDDANEEEMVHNSETAAVAVAATNAAVLPFKAMARPPSLSNRSNDFTHHHFRVATMSASASQDFQHLNNFHQASHAPSSSSTIAATPAASSIPDILKTKQLLRQFIQARTSMATMMNDGSMRLLPPSSSSQAWEQQQQQQQHQQQQQQVVSTTRNSFTLPMAHSNHHVSLTFPQKLMKILSNASYSDIISWLPHGKGFLLIQKRRFAEEVLPKFFKQSKFASFTRKLNRWGFVRVTRGPEMGAYYHKYFVRGNFLLCTRMTCQSTTTDKKTSSSSSTTTTTRTASLKQAKSVGTSAATNKEEEEEGGCAPSSPSSHASSSNSCSASSNSSKSSSTVVVATSGGVKSSSSKGPVQLSSSQRLPSLLDLGKANQSPAHALPGTTTGIEDHDLCPRMMMLNGSNRVGGSDTGVAPTGATGNDHPPWMNQSALLHHHHHSRGHVPHHSPQWTTTTTTSSPPRLLPTVTDQQQRFLLQNLLGINTTTSRNHQHIMAKALDALKSSSNYGDTEIMLTKATYNNNSNISKTVRQQQHPLEHRQHATMNQHFFLPTPSQLRQIRTTTANSVEDEIRAEAMMQTRRSDHEPGGSGGSANAAGSRRNLIYRGKEDAKSTSALEVSSLQKDHPAMKLLKSIADTQEPGPTNHLRHQQSVYGIRKETAPTVNEEDVMSMTSLAHYLQQRRLRAKAEARLRLMRAQSSGHRESKRQRCDNPAVATPPSASVGSGEGGKRREEAQVDAGVVVVDRSSTQNSKPSVNETSASLVDAASLLVDEFEHEARKHHHGGMVVLPPRPQPLFVAVAPKDDALRSPQRKPGGPVRRASAA